MMAGTRIASGRADLAATVFGAGDPVIFLHANVCDSRMWTPQMQTVSTARKAIAYDRRGFGTTRAEPEDHNAVIDLLAVVDALADGQPAVLVGCSQGGRIALDAALLYPSLFRALVLIAPSVTGAPDPVHPPEIARRMQALKDAEAARDLDRVNAIKAHIFLDGPTAPEGRVSGAARELFLEMHGIALRSPGAGTDTGAPPNYRRLREIDLPTLVIWGELDLPHVRERSAHVANNVPHAVRRPLADTAHLPSLDKPAEISALIADFIAEN